MPSFQWQVPSAPFWVLDVDIVVVVMGTIVVVGIVVVTSDIGWDPVLEHSLTDLSRKSFDDSSILDYKC